jgi:hypothetical protein
MRAQIPPPGQGTRRLARASVDASSHLAFLGGPEDIVIELVQSP